MKGNRVYQSMRMLCAIPEFGDQLFDALTPMDLSAFLYAFKIFITKKQSQKYMQFWRQFFTNRSWLLWIRSQGFEVSFIGNDLITMANWVRNPGLMNLQRRTLYLDLNLVSCVASRKYALPSLETFDLVVNEKIKHLREFSKNNDFDQVLQPGISANYCEHMMGRGLANGRSFAWLDLTIISTVKHEMRSGYQGLRMRADRSMSTGLWHGERTMRKWRVPGSAEAPAKDMGVLLEMDNSGVMDMPMNIAVSKFWCLTKVESKNSCTGAYLLRQERSVDCTELLIEMDCLD